MAIEGVSPVEGWADWQYGPFSHDRDEGVLRIPLVRADGRTVVFALPDLMSETEDIQSVALIVIAALERVEAREGLGA
jgi:hypothetical protein